MTVNKLFWFQTIPVPFDQLPVELPEITEFTGKGTSPLESAEDWLRVKCPKYVVHISDAYYSFVLSGLHRVGSTI